MTAALTMTRPEKPAKAREPERRCIATGESQPKHGLIRFVVGPDNRIVPDLGERLPGRGIWLSSTREALDLAIRKKLFARAAKQAVEVDPALADQIEAMLVKRCQDVIGLARRSDRMIAGYDRVLEAMEKDRVAVVAIAHDAGTGRRSVEYGAGNLPIVRGLSSLELGNAAGKGTVAFLVVLRGGLAETLVRENDRLTGFRPAGMDVNK